jgi:hypothetical protein
MTSNDEMQQLISEAVINAEFRKQLLADPQQAAQLLGIVLSEEDIARLKNLAPDLFADTTDRVEERISKMGIWLIP